MHRLRRLRENGMLEFIALSAYAAGLVWLCCGFWLHNGAKSHPWPARHPVVIGLVAFVALVVIGAVARVLFASNRFDHPDN